MDSKKSLPPPFDEVPELIPNLIIPSTELEFDRVMEIYETFMVRGHSIRFIPKGSQFFASDKPKSI